MTPEERIEKVREFLRTQSGHNPRCGRIYGAHFTCCCGYDSILAELDQLKAEIKHSTLTS
jgi:hypothetical protein